MSSLRPVRRASGRLFQRRTTLFTAIAAGLLSTCPLALADSIPQPTSRPSSQDQTVNELRQEINALNTKVDRLEANQQSAPLSTAATQQAANPTPPNFFTTDDLSSGYDPLVGFVIRSDNGDFSLHPGAVIDFRNMTSYRAQVAPNNGSEEPGPRYSTQSGFDVTRFRLTFDGHFTKDLYYFIQLQDDQGTTFGLLDAYGLYHLTDGLSLKFGQFKDPVWHERNLSEASLLAVDRSLVENYLGGGQTSRVQGVGIVYDQDRFREQFVYTDGFDSLNTKFIDAGGIGAGIGGGAGVTPTDFGFSDRTDYLLLGDRTDDLHPYHQYDNGFTALGAQQNILVAGIGGDYSQAGSNSVLFHTADLTYQDTSGFSAYGGYLGSYRALIHNQGVTPGFYYDPGFIVQAAYLVTPVIEPFARYDYTYLPTGSTTGLATGEVQEITVGANYYIHKQNIKFTLDASWLPNGAPSDVDPLGVLKNSGENEIVIRAQFQIAL
jgi:hypothetical protein